MDAFANVNVVLGCDTETSRIYGEIKNALSNKGRPIPENDLWIAAISIQHGLNSVSRDAHFEQIDNLKIETW